MLKLLYVEDDPKSRNVLRMIERINPGLMKLVMFEDSENFEARLLELDFLPDLILLDIHVKPITGFEMLKIVRALTKYNHTPTVALTASVMNEEVEQLRLAGFQGVFSKPVDLDSFPDLLQRVLKGEKIWYVW